MLLFFGCLMLLAKGVRSDKHRLEAVLTEYDNLVLSVQDLFGSSSVFIINAGFYEDLAETVLMAKMSREFSSKPVPVLSQNINFTKLQEEVKYYNGKAVQPLFVIMLKTVYDLHQFAEITKHYNMALHTWLVIFMQSSMRTLNDYCREPRENLFNLVVSSRMLVKCYGDAVLREWYSMDEQKVETFDYGLWSAQKKRVIRFAEDHFFQRRSNFKGARLKVSAVKEKIPGWNSTMNGFFGVILEELANLMNFTIEFDSIESTYGSYNESTRRWNGVVGRLVDRQIDIGIGEFSLTRQRVAVIDFTIPLLLTSADIYMKRPDMTNVDWLAYVKAFHRDIWLIIIAILIVSPIILTVMWKVIKGYDVTYHLFDEYLSIWGIYCQKPLPDFPTASSLRLAYISIFISSLVLFAVYSAYLTSYLTLFKPSLPFNTFEGFVRDGTYKLIVIRHSSNHDLFKRVQKSILYDMGKFLKSETELPTDVFAAVKQVCNEKTVFFTNQLLIEKIAGRLPCELMSLTRGRVDHASLVLAKDSPYTEIFNYNLKQLRALGIIECLKRRYFKKYVVQPLTYLPVEFDEIIPVLGILVFGIAIGLHLLFCEFMFYKKKRRSVNSIQMKSISVRHSTMRVYRTMLSRMTCFLLVEFVYIIKIGLAMSDEQMMNHVRLAAEVKNYYRASSVFNVYNDKSSDMTIMPTMLRLSLRFSHNNILVQSMKMSNVQRYIKYYKYRTSLYIITLKTQLDMIEFVKFVSNFEMSLNLWLVFIYKNRDLLKYCGKPDRNWFNVKFDTKMLVKCENDPMVREWYALREDEMKVNDLSIWSIERGLSKVTNKSLWERRNTLDGIPLRIATVKESAYSSTELERKRGTLYGLFGSVLRELAATINFTVELIAVEDMYGNFESESDTWSGVMGRLINNEIDIGVAEFGRSNDRLEVVDFTVPLLLTRMNLYLRQPNMSAIMWSTYVQVFDTRIWTYSLVLVLVCSVVISLMAAKVERKQVWSVAADNWFYVWSIQCQQGFPEFPIASSLRIAFMSIMITSMVTYSSYSATLTSYLAHFVPSLPFTSEREFLIDTSYSLTAIRGSVYHDIIERANDPRTMVMRKRMKRDKELPNTMLEAVNQVCHEKVVLFTNELFVDKISNKLPCPLVSISLGRLDSIAFSLTKRSQFRGILNFYIEHFRSYGIIKMLRSRHLPKMICTKINYTPVSFHGIVPLITIYLSGVGLAMVILICECLHRRCWCARRSKKKFHKNLLDNRLICALNFTK